MPRKSTDEEFISVWKRYGSPIAVARALNTDPRNIIARRKRLEEKYGIVLETADQTRRGRPKTVLPRHGMRALSENVTGTVIVASDLHAWPGDRSVAFSALVALVKELKPSLLIANGDSVDMASISRHPPIGWQSVPTVLEELDAAKELHAELEAAAPSSTPLIWLYGNHCLRFNTRLASEAPEFHGIPGASLEDHFPAWDFAMSLKLNKNTIVFHSYHNGIHAAYNNTLKSGWTTCTGHTHRLQSVMFSDFDGVRWGIECGTLSDFGPEQQKFLYTMDRPVNWSQGFAVLTFAPDGTLLEPEFCRVINGVAYFRGSSVCGAILPQKKRSKKAA